MVLSGELLVHGLRMLAKTYPTYIHPRPAFTGLVQLRIFRLLLCAEVPPSCGHSDHRPVYDLLRQQIWPLSLHPQ